MAGGLIQLVAYGIQDIFLTNNPQITFFKIVYRRYTNFSIEEIPQNFIHTPDFGKKITCILSRTAGDLIRKIHLVVTLPQIPSFTDVNNNVDQIAKFAWVKRIGFRIINSIEFEMGSEVIDKQYGDWLNIWYDLTIPTRKDLDKMLGNVEELTDFSNGKNAYKLFIPLQFWFNRTTGLALPMISLQYNQIKINLEISNFNLCYISVPTHVINIDTDLVNFEPYEYITQTANGITSLARFIHFDVINRQLYLWRISDAQFQSLTVTDTSTIQTEADQRAILYAKDLNGNFVNAQYFITGLTTGFQAMPKINATENIYQNTSVNFKNIKLSNAFLLVEYIYLDEEERVRFAQAKHEYLIEQVQYNGEKTITGTNQSFKLGFSQPCKEFQWVTQLTLVQNPRINDYFNYTDNIMVNINTGEPIGKNIILNETILFNGHERVTFRDSQYFSYIQTFQNHTKSPPEGINVYSFALYPEKHQPSCQANTSQLDNILLRLGVNQDISFQNTAKLRVYALVYNILKVANGISSLTFSIDRENANT